MDNHLYHAGIKGMKWGRRRYQNEDGSLTPEGKKRYGYKSTSLAALKARKANERVDKGFKNWKDNTEKRDNAIELGKKATKAKLDYEANPSDKSLKSQYKTANKEYRKALSENTTYRKGVVRQEVGRDAARKYLSEAKKVGKQLDSDPSNKQLQKKYNQLMSKHDVERANARRAMEVATKRSNKKASIKRTMTITMSTVAGTAAVAAGTYAANKMLKGKGITIGRERVANVANMAKKVKDLFGYVY